MVGEGGDEGPEALKREQRSLFDSMTTLEEEYEAGKIDQKTYRELNASNWEELTEIQRRINAPHGERGHVSLLLYLGAGLIALGGLLSAIAVASVNGGQLPPSYSDYWAVVIIVGVAFVLVGFARQAERMHK
jgi:hypothetical protein